MPGSLIGFYAFWAGNYAFWAGNYAVLNFGQHRDGRSKRPKTTQNQKRSEAEKNASPHPQNKNLKKNKKISHRLEDLDIVFQTRARMLQTPLPCNFFQESPEKAMMSEVFGWCFMRAGTLGPKQGGQRRHLTAHSYPAPPRSLGEH